MNVSLHDLRRNADEVEAAIERQEEISLTRNGKPIAKVIPCEGTEPEETPSVVKHPAVGMWSDHDQTRGVACAVRGFRKGRSDDK